VGRTAAVAAACLAAAPAVSTAAGLRPAVVPRPEPGEENHAPPPPPPPPSSASFPLVVRTRHASAAEADGALLGVDLDAMGRGRHLEAEKDSDRSVGDAAADGASSATTTAAAAAAAEPPHAAHPSCRYERDVLLHSPEEWTVLREALGKDDGRTGGGAACGWEIDEVHTERFHSFRADDLEEQVPNAQEGGIEGGEGSKKARHLAAGASAPTKVYETMPHFSCYRTVQGTYETMYDLQARRPDLAAVEVIGRSFQGEPILLLQLTGPESAASPVAGRQPAVLTAGLHAREYAPPEMATRFAEHLVDGYGADADVTAILDHTVLHLVLQANPDSRRIAERNYAASQPRKNQDNADGCSSRSQWGTDLNRNFDFQHGSPGASSSPCHITYHGKRGGSEGETQAIQALSRRVFPEWQRKVDAEANAFEAFPDTAVGLFVDIHSYGDDIIFPYGYQNWKAGNHDAFKSMSHKICSINGYDPSGSGYYFLGRTSGDTLDYHYGALGVASILYEVGTAWAESCSTFESSVFPPNLDALLYTAKLAKTPYRTSLGPDVMSMNVTVSADGNQVTVSAEVSDYAMTALPKKAQLSTAVQNIQSVKAYLDSHPYDASPSQPLPMTTPSGQAFASHTESVSLSIDSSSIDGRHTICLVASDAHGYDGTVSCKYIDIPVKADTAPTPPEQGDETTTIEEQTTNQNNLTNTTDTDTVIDSTDVTTNTTETTETFRAETGTTTTAATQTVPAAAPRNNGECLDISNEEACNNDIECRWKTNKSKCVGICQGRNNEGQCLKHPECKWDPNLTKCSKK